MISRYTYSLSSFSLAVNLCKNIIPIYIGACRAIGRMPNDENLIPLFLRLFPEPPLPPSCDLSQCPSEFDSNSNLSGKGTLTKKTTTSPNLQRIIPRSFSSLSASATWTGTFPSRESGNDLSSLNGISSTQRISSFQSQVSANLISSERQNEGQILFYKFGSCFSHLFRMKLPDFMSRNQNKFYRLSLSLLQTTLSVAKKLISRDLLDSLDEQVREFLAVSHMFNAPPEIILMNHFLPQTSHSNYYPYKSVSEIITLVTVGILRELLRAETGML